jgi:hypothetical protein
MPKVELLSDADSESPNNHPSTPVEEKTLSFPLIGQPGEAVFRLPTIGNAIAVQSRYPNLEAIDICRKMAEDALISWGDNTSLPPDDEIDMADDYAMVELFMIDGSTGEFDVLPDKSLACQTAKGLLVLRRPTRVDARKGESLSAQVLKGKVNAITSDLMWACDLCVKWWNESRKIMPGDFNDLPISDYVNIQAALRSFFPRRTAPNRTGVS